MCIIAPVNSNYGKLSHQSIDELEVGQVNELALNNN